MAPKRGARHRAGTRYRLSALLLAGALGCSRSPVARLPEVSVPLDLTPTPDQPDEPVPGTEAEPPEQEPAPEAPEGRQGPGQGPRGRAPDPPALRSSRQYELQFRYAQGQVELAEARVRTFQRPVVSPRRLGRFAVELWIGLELVERVRFDFPLLGAEASQGNTLERGLVTTQRVLVPATDRPTRALLIDRSTGQEIELPWPPVEEGQDPNGQQGRGQSGPPEEAGAAGAAPGTSAE